jgi:hypothetical protein
LKLVSSSLRLRCHFIKIWRDNIAFIYFMLFAYTFMMFNFVPNVGQNYKMAGD